MQPVWEDMPGHADVRSLHKIHPLGSAMIVMGYLLSVNGDGLRVNFYKKSVNLPVFEPITDN